MTEYRYFGRFNPRLNAPVPGFPNAGEMDESEARRRYGIPKSALEFVPPADPATGFVPFIVEVKTGPEPVFHAVRYTRDALPELELWWYSVDGGIFLREVILRFFDLKPWTSIVDRTDHDWDTQIILRIKEDGRGFLQINERGEEQFQTARTTIDTALATRAVPEWGEWESLLDDSGLMDQARPS